MGTERDKARDAVCEAALAWLREQEDETALPVDRDAAGGRVIVAAAALQRAVAPPTAPRPADPDAQHPERGAEWDALTARMRELEANFAVTLRTAVTLRVVCAAILIRGNEFHDDLVLSTPRPGRHSDIIRAASAAGIVAFTHDEEQGFMLSDGSFVRRKPALVIAREAGQVLRETGPHIGLFSEDVW